MKRPGSFLNTLLWSAVGFVLVAMVALGVFTNLTLRSVEKHLPSTLFEQLHDLNLAIEDLQEVVSAAEHARSVRSPESFARLRKKLIVAHESIMSLRNTYVFDNLVQASAFHAVVAPAIADLQLWLSEGVSGFGPETDTTLDIVVSRISKTFKKAKALNEASEAAARRILTEQRKRLDRFLSNVNLLFAMALVITLIMVLLLKRQYVLQRREAEAQAESERVQEELAKSEEKYRRLFETSAIGLFLMTDVFVDCNEQACRLWRCTRDDIVGHSPSEFSPPQQPDGRDSTEAANTYIRAALSGQSQQFYWKHRRKDGALMDSEVTLQLLPIDERELLVATLIDITDRKRAEESRRLNESRLQTLLQLNRMTRATLHEITEFAMEEAVRLTQSTIGYLAFLNEEETVLTMHSWSRQAMRECQITDKPLEYPVEKTGLWGEAVRQRRPIITNDYQAPNPHKRGTPDGHVEVARHMNVPIFDEDRIVVVAGVGNKPMDYDEADVRQLTLLMTGMWRIVQRKRAEEALRESRERFQELAELLPETIFETDVNGNLTFVNQNAFTHFGYSQEDLEQGLNCFDLILPEDRSKAIENAIKVISGERIGLTEYTLLRKDGSTFPAILHTSAKYSDGKPIGLRGIVIDITETKELEAQLRHAHKMEAVGTLAGGIAHDFNNLLQAVQGYAELLLLKRTEKDEGHPELDAIRRAAERGGELTRQLLTFSRKVESKLQSSDLNRIVEGVRLLLERTIPKMINIRLNLMGNLYSVNADASQIEQVLMNLALNSRDAMPDGGTLSIETRNVTLDNKYCHSRPELNPGRYVLLSVVDTGQGMDKTTQEHIFDPFFTTKEVGKGTGLGLAMVYGIVKSHHGHITCGSKPGEGTVFEIYLPAVEQLEGTATNDAGAKQLHGGNETVLFVDDDESLRTLGVQILQVFGYTVISAPDGEGALQVYSEGKDGIDLVILDLIMPGMGGGQCLQKILEINPRAKIIIASGCSADGETEKIAETGAKAFIGKPYNVREMLKVVREILMNQ